MSARIDVGGPGLAVIFLHVGKTGGSTLQRILYRHVAPGDRMRIRATPRTGRPTREDSLRRFASVHVETRARLKLVEGHVIYGIHDLLPGPSTYITLLRDPVALSISQYRYVCRTPAHPLHDEALRLGSLDAYVRSGISLETDNSQVRAISGDTTTPFGGCSAEMLGRAQAHLDATFSVVGVTEAFDDTLALLERTFGWSRLWYTSANVAPRSHVPVPASTRRFLEEQNRYDLELHERARSELRQTMAADPAMQARTRRIRTLNAVYRPWAHLTHDYPRRVRDAVMATRERLPLDA